MVTLTEHDADSILKVIRSEKQDLVSGYKQLNDMIESLITSLGEDGKEEKEKYESEKADNENKYYEKLDEYDNMIILLTTGSDIKKE
jgi:hypothetical protein